MRITSNCPVGCNRKVKEGHLMCAACWREVPEHLKKDVQRTWRKWRRDFGDHEAMTAYRAARDAAIGSIG